MTLLDGQVAFITGAARGQGRSHALVLAAAGADIVACDVPGPMDSPGYPLATHADLEMTAHLVEELGRRCLPIPVDIRDSGQVEGAVEQTLGEFGRLDIALANAAIVSTGPLVGVTDTEWSELLDTNLTGTFNTLRAVVPAMQERRYGRIVVTSSMGARMGVPGLSAYAATKWGVIGMAKCLALEVAKEGITVNVVCPTTVQTPMVQPDPDQDVPDDVVRRFLRSNPVPQPWIQAEDVSRAVLYLVSDPGVITGSVLEIGLGSSARMH